MIHFFHPFIMDCPNLSLYVCYDVTELTLSDVQNAVMFKIVKNSGAAEGLARGYDSPLHHRTVDSIFCIDLKQMIIY